MKESEYIFGVATRNPSDFTPKACYDEIDRQAKRDRSKRHLFIVGGLILWVVAVTGVIYALKHL